MDAHKAREGGPRTGWRAGLPLQRSRAKGSGWRGGNSSESEIESLGCSFHREFSFLPNLKDIQRLLELLYIVNMSFNLY